MGFLKHFQPCDDDCADCKSNPCDSCCPDFTVEYRTRSATKTKCGFEEFGTPSTPPKIYLEKIQDGGINQSSGSGTTLEETYNTWSGSHTFSRPSCSETDTRQVQIRRVLGSDVGGPCDNYDTITTEKGRIDGFGEWSTGTDNGCNLLSLSINCNAGSAVYADVCCLFGGGTVVSTTYKRFADPADCGLVGVSGLPVTLTLFNEYTTYQLYDDTALAVGSASWSAWSTTPTSALYDLSTDEQTITLRDLEVRVLFSNAASSGCKLEFDLYSNGEFSEHYCYPITSGTTSFTGISASHPIFGSSGNLTFENFEITSGVC